MNLIDWLAGVGDWLRGYPPERAISAQDVADHHEAKCRFDAEMEALRAELEWHQRGDGDDG